MRDHKEKFTDTLELNQVYAWDDLIRPPRAKLRAGGYDDYGDWSADLSIEQATQLRDWLTKWIDHYS